MINWGREGDGGGKPWQGEGAGRVNRNNMQ